MSQHSTRESKRAIRRAFGPEVVALIDAHAEAIGTLGKTMNELRARIMSLERAASNAEPTTLSKMLCGPTRDGQ